MSNAPDITIGVMCYNEAGSIEKTLNGIIAFLNLHAGLTAEILVVDDGSADNSVEITRKIQASESRIRLVEHVQNKGIGMTLQSIYTGATGNIITAVPGDGQFDIGELTPWIGLQAGNLVNLYRVENTTYGLFRNGLSLINKLLNRYIVGLKIKDVNWILIFHRTDLQKAFPLKLTSSLVTSEICAKLVWNRCRISEAPSKYLPRTAGKSRGASFRIVLKAATDMFKLISVTLIYKINHNRT